jgi:hypothetical protein
MKPRSAARPGAELGPEIADRWYLSADALRRVLAEEGCPLCRLLGQAADDLMDRLLSSLSLPEPMLEQTREARGFCSDHAWRLFEAAAARTLPAAGVVQSMRDVLAQALAALGLYGKGGAEGQLDPAVFKRTIRHGWTKRLARRLEPSGRCPVCLALKRIEETLGYQLVTLLGREDLRVGYRSDAALCLPHFRWVLEAAGDKAVLDCLVEAERERLESMLSNRTGEGWAKVLGHVVGVPWAVAWR